MMTGVRHVLGHRSYMSPEQARGKGTVDSGPTCGVRGCVPLRNLTARKAFTADPCRE